MAPTPEPTDRPNLRPVEFDQVTHDGVPGIVLHDPLGLAEATFVPEDLLPVVVRFDGSRSIAQVRAEASRQVGEDLPFEFVAGLVRQLDERGLLLGTNFDRIAHDAAERFVGAGVRPARHAGSAGYPAAPPLLRDELRRLVPAPDATPNPGLRGLVAPHIDLARGAAGYAAAYRRLLAAPPAELYVVFGTGHSGPDAPVTGLALDWQTPLGTAVTDREFVARVHDRIGAPQPADLLRHRDEHSLEFQMLFLQHLHERRGGDAPFRVAGFLCGALPSTDGDPLREAWCRQLLAAFRDAEHDAQQRVCYIAGADLAHIGPLFGDADAVTATRLTRLDTEERARLAHLAGGTPGAFHKAVACDRNPDRVCSAPAITLCAALAGGPGELLHYGRATADDGSQSVSFCAMAFPGSTSAGAPACTTS